MRDVHVTVAVVVERDGRFLFVEETIGARTVLNQPAGHWEAGETLVEAAVREALEETAWDVTPTALLGVYEFHPADLAHGFVRFAFRADAVRHHPQRPLDPGIVRAVWLTPEDLAREAARHRSPMVGQCVEDYAAGRAYPLAVIAHLV
jgi:8-oxo-dGTP pyrophosphatase MutT (NUDIX family)